MRRQGGGDKELWLLFWFSIGSCFSLLFWCCCVFFVGWWLWCVVVFSWWVSDGGVSLLQRQHRTLLESLRGLQIC
ncbi:hypothetical protein P8452_44028 [Trifolium repens]|nr:hypothetical protein P8452_44028 [Trifolium repens]